MPPEVPLIPLPIDAHIPQIVSTLRSAGALALTAPPGSGKTTRIPRALFDAGFSENGEILVLEPRRLAARLAAARVAEEMGEDPGGVVGYSIRFENVSGPKTRIRFLTEAILTRRLSGDPALSGVSVVILDEFHERHIETDIGLALVRRAMKDNQRLKLLVMSATLDADPVAAYLGGAPIISLSEAPHELAFEYEEKPDARPLQEKIRSGFLRLFRSGIQGDILVFLPGAAEIRRAAEALGPPAESAGFTISLLHGNLPAREQRLALRPGDKPKVILSTNVAETSVTIPGIAAVIGSGLARVAGYSAWSGFPTLATAKISKSSATQRAGRAGRTQAGIVLRLYSRADYNARPQRDTPEILRSDLAETALLMHGAGIRDLGKFDWFEAPPGAALEQAENLLRRLGATDDGGCLTETGRRMLALPAHPRLSRLMLEGEKLNVAKESRLMAALIAERDIRLSSRARMGEAFNGSARRNSGFSDPLELMDCFYEAEAAGFDAGRLLRMNLDPGAVHTVRQTARQFEARADHSRVAGAQKKQHALKGRSVIAQGNALGRSVIAQGNAPGENEEALRMAILAAFPDRVAKRRAAGERELLLAKGGAARLLPSSIVDEPMFLVAVDIEEKKDAGAFRTAQTAKTADIRLASAIEIEWLAEFFPEKLVETAELRWNAAAGRVDETRRALYEAITLEETVRPAPPSDETSRILAEAVRTRGIERLPGYETLETFRLRLNLVAETFPEEGWPRIGEDEIQEGVRDMCRGRRSFIEAESVSLKDVLMEKLTEKQRARLDREAPERVTLTAKRSVKINYETGRPPWIESRLQDFFGMTETPRICSGRVPLTVHLLAPNRRAVQVTQDISGFWERHYPAIRRELMRRYPKHVWPVNG
jgi:ATP-dependent helicase HrpB